MNKRLFISKKTKFFEISGDKANKPRIVPPEKIPYSQPQPDRPPNRGQPPPERTPPREPNKPRKTSN